MMNLKIFIQTDDDIRLARRGTCSFLTLFAFVFPFFPLKLKLDFLSLYSYFATINGYFSVT